MPVLKKRLDGGYYILGRLPGVGRISTWQVTPEGVALLREILRVAGVTDEDWERSAR